MNIRPATEADLENLLRVHNDAIRNLDAIWIEKEETLEGRAKWLKERQAAGLPVVVAESDDGEFYGYGTYGPFRPREGYRATMEHSLYLLPEARGKGAGKALLKWLIEDARQAGYHVLVAVLDSKNEVSVKLHERFGFVSSGLLPQVGQKRGRWLNMHLMTLVLDERERP